MWRGTLLVISPVPEARAHTAGIAESKQIKSLETSPSGPQQTKNTSGDESLQQGRRGGIWIEIAIEIEMGAIWSAQGEEIDGSWGVTSILRRGRRGWSWWAPSPWCPSRRRAPPPPWIPAARRLDRRTGAKRVAVETGGSCPACCLRYSVRPARLVSSWAACLLVYVGWAPKKSGLGRPSLVLLHVGRLIEPAGAWRRNERTKDGLGAELTAHQRKPSLAKLTVFLLKKKKKKAS